MRTVALSTARVPSARVASDWILCVVPLLRARLGSFAFFRRVARIVASCCAVIPGIACSASGGAVFGSGLVLPAQIVSTGAMRRYSAGVMPSTICASSIVAAGGGIRRPLAVRRIGDDGGIAPVDHAVGELTGLVGRQPGGPEQRSQ